MFSSNIFCAKQVLFMWRPFAASIRGGFCQFGSQRSLIIIDLERKTDNRLHVVLL